MADNVPLTPGSGVNIAADEVTYKSQLVQVQYIKIMDGFSDSVNILRISAQGGMFVEPPKSATANLGSTTISTTSNPIITSNPNRVGFSIYNDHATLSMYVRFGFDASLSLFAFRLGPGDYYESPAGFVYTGTIYAISTAISTTARTVEYLT